MLIKISFRQRDQNNALYPTNITILELKCQRFDSMKQNCLSEQLYRYKMDYKMKHQPS